MKRLIVVFSVLAILFVAAVVAPSFVDWNKYKGQIIQQAEKATGLDIDIAGDLSMAILPFPHLSIAGLTVDNPDAKKQKPLAKADSVSVQVALLPLFGGDVEISDVSLQSPDIYVVVEEDGTPSWQTEKMRNKAEGEANSGQLGNSIALNSINIKNGALVYIDNSKKTKHTISELNITVSAEGLMGPYDSSGSLVYNGQKIVFEHESGDLTKLKESLPVDVSIKWPDLGADMKFSGVVAQKNSMEAQGNLAFNSNQPAVFAKVYGASVPEHLNKKTSLKGFVTIQGADLNLRDATIVHGTNKVIGYALMTNYKPGSSEPLNADVNFESDAAVNLDQLVALKKNAKSSGGFLPESITLPQDITGNINFKAPTVILGGQSYQGVELAIATKNKAFDIQSKISAPGQTNIQFAGVLAFAAKSKSSSDGVVTMSDPSLKGTIKIFAQEPDKLAEALSKKKLADNLKRALAYNLDSEIEAAVTPHALTASAGYVKLDDTRINFSGSFKKGVTGKRDTVNVIAKAVTVDADKWLQRMSKRSAAIPAISKNTADVKEVAASINTPFDVIYDFEVQGLRFKGRDYLSLQTSGALTGDDLRIESANLKSNAGDTFVLSGGVKNVSKIGAFDLTLKADIVDVEQTLASFNLKNISLPTRVGKASVVSEFKGSPENLAFTTNIDALRASTQATGAVSDVLTAPKVSDLTLRLKHPNYVDLIRLFKPDFSSGVAIKKDVDVFASMKRENNLYTFSELQATLGPSSVKGDLSVKMDKKPYVKAALDFTELPLDALTGAAKGNTRNDMRQKSGSQDVRWSRNAIDTTWMHKADFDIKATAKSFSYGAWTFLNAGANLTLKNGNLQIKQLDGAFAGGQVAITGDIKSSPEPRQPLSVTSNFIIQNVSLEQFVQSFSGGSKLVEASGDISLNGNVAATGLSPAALVFDLNGKSTASGSNLVFEGFDLARLSRALNESSSSFTQNFSALLNASMGGGTTKFDTLDGQFTIKEGVVNFDKMLLAGADADVDTTGNVNLPLWTVDLESSVQLKEPEDAPPLKAAFKGSLSNPGKTFGQNALNQYFQRQLGGMVINPNLDKLDKIDESGTLKNIIGGFTGAQPKQKTPITRTTPESTSAPDASSEPVTAPTAGDTPADKSSATHNDAPETQQQETRPITKEEAIFGVIDGLLNAQ